jgi:acyl-CoA reductase-like NAD-dependent aldehyde dehydrogenase
VLSCRQFGEESTYRGGFDTHCEYHALLATDPGRPLLRSDGLGVRRKRVGMGTLTSFGPRTGQAVGTVTTTTLDGVANATERSRKAFHDWSGLSHPERRPCLKSYKRAVLGNTDRIAAVVRAETGKAITDACVSDVIPTLNVMDFSNRSAEKLLRPWRGSHWPYPMVCGGTGYRP